MTNPRPIHLKDFLPNFLPVGIVFPIFAIIAYFLTPAIIDCSTASDPEMVEPCKEALESFRSAFLILIPLGIGGMFLLMYKAKMEWHRMWDRLDEQKWKCSICNRKIGKHDLLNEDEKTGLWYHKKCKLGGSD